MLFSTVVRLCLAEAFDKLDVQSALRTGVIKSEIDPKRTVARESLVCSRSHSNWRFKTGRERGPAEGMQPDRR